MSRRLGRVVAALIEPPTPSGTEEPSPSTSSRAVARFARMGARTLTAAVAGVFGAVHAAEGALAGGRAPPSRREVRGGSRRGGSTPPLAAGDAAGGRVASVAERARVASGAGGCPRPRRPRTSRGRSRARVDVVRGGVGSAPGSGRAPSESRRARDAEDDAPASADEDEQHPIARVARRRATRTGARASGVRGRRTAPRKRPYSEESNNIRSVRARAAHQARRERARATSSGTLGQSNLLIRPRLAGVTGVVVRRRPARPSLPTRSSSRPARPRSRARCLRHARARLALVAALALVLSSSAAPPAPPPARTRPMTFRPRGVTRVPRPRASRAGCGRDPLRPAGPRARRSAALRRAFSPSDPLAPGGSLPRPPAIPCGAAQPFPRIVGASPRTMIPRADPDPMTPRTTPRGSPPRR